MSLKLRTLQGIVWSALGNWLQLMLNVVTFFIVARHLEPIDFGLFGAALLVIGAIDILLGPTLTQSLEQRDILHRDHIDATFAVAAAFGLLLTAGVVLAAPVLARIVGDADGALALQWMAIGLLASSLGGVPTSLLARELRFGTISRIGVVAGVCASLVTVSVAVLGGGVWALVAGDVTHRSIRAAGAFAVTSFRPAWPREWARLRDLGSFNALTFVTFGLDYLDLAIPRLLTSRTLGTAELGYYAFAQRVFELLTQVFLHPIERVVMTSIARLQGDMAAVRTLITSLYGLSTLIAYPAFLGAIVLTPDFVALQGPQWAPTVEPMQILLLVGLRIATGAFNAGILRGAGFTRGPVLILSIGVVLQLLLVPIAAHASITWVATAVLVRTLATWPLGCWLIKRATGLSILRQLTIGTPALVAALIMCGAMEMVLSSALPNAAPALRLAIGTLTGCPIYAAALLVFSPRERRLAGSVWAAGRRGGRARVLAHLRAHFGQAE